VSYADYAHPPGGYTGYARRPGAYGSSGKPAAAGTASAPAQGTFTELPVTGGVGEFHLNHYIGYSAYQKMDPARGTRAAAKITRLLLDQFCSVFSMKNVALATPHPELPFDGETTVEFEIGGNVGDTIEELGGLLHSDWVVLRTHADSGTFCASTLKRDWEYPAERNTLKMLAKVDEFARAVGEKDAVSKEAIAKRFIEVNQHHFLAGRRSFKVGYDGALGRFFMETAAFERSSLCEYSVVERTGVLRQEITALWVHLIDNFEGLGTTYWIAPDGAPEVVPPGYSIQGNAAYFNSEHKTAASAVSAPWFAGVLLRHPGLLAGLAL
jgi:hypothetical protein